MLDKYIVLTSEYGSGARLVGKALADRLGINFYGEEDLLIKASNEDGISEEELREYDEVLKKSLIDTSIYKSLNHEKIYNSYSKAILKIVKEGPCVLMERGADIVLKGKVDFINIYAYSNSIDNKIKRCEIVGGYSREQAPEIIQNETRQRKNYYNLFSDIKRGNIEEYDLCINTDSFNTELLKMDKCADILMAAI